MNHILDNFDKSNHKLLTNQLLTGDISNFNHAHMVYSWTMSQGLVTFGNVMLPHWILHPVKASIDILLQVDNWCTYGYIPLGLRDLWLNTCVPSYIQDYSIHCLRFARQVDPAMLAIASDSINTMCGRTLPKTPSSVKSTTIPSVARLKGGKKASPSGMAQQKSNTSGLIQQSQNAGMTQYRSIYYWNDTI